MPRSNSNARSTLVAERVFEVKWRDVQAEYRGMRGRVVIVTGGATDIGEAVVKSFAAQGTKCCFIDVQNEAATSPARAWNRLDLALNEERIA